LAAAPQFNVREVQATFVVLTVPGAEGVVVTVTVAEPAVNPEVLAQPFASVTDVSV
jgi:hypothetical protein